LDFDNIDLDFYYDFISFLEKKNLATNTIGHKITTLKTFLNAATERAINKNLAFKSSRFVAPKEESDQIYLTEKDINKIKNLDLSSNERLNKVQDIFIFSVNVGLRFGDVQKITKEMINFEKNFLEIKQNKTANKIVIPLTIIALSILKKYNYSLPKISNQKFNNYIKEVGKLAEINDTITKEITKGGVKRIKRYKKYELIGHHTARRSFATNLYLKDVAIYTIMQITGHKTEKAFLKYIRLTPTEHATKLRNTLALNGEFMRKAN